MIFDTHAHYDDKAFDEDRDTLIPALRDDGVEGFVNVGAEYQGCLDSLKIAQQYPFAYCAIGIHPSEVEKMTEEKLNELKQLCLDNAIYNGGKVVSVGEIGLDYFYEEPPKEIQKEWFIRQIQMARDVSLPMIIHSRDAAKDTLDILKEQHAEEIGGIIHCFSYSPEMATEYLNMGFYVGIGGVLTFKNAKKLIDVVNMLPMDRIVLETDCPYLAPVPHRGERNDSRNIKYVVSALSQIKDIPEEEIIKITTENAKRVYGICQP